MRRIEFLYKLKHSFVWAMTPLGLIILEYNIRLPYSIDDILFALAMLTYIYIDIIFLSKIETAYKVLTSRYPDFYSFSSIYRALLRGKPLRKIYTTGPVITFVFGTFLVRKYYHTINEKMIENGHKNT